MSKAKHTAWKSERISDDLFFVKDMDGNTVATVWDTKPNIDGSANTRLIEASPEMYEMLKGLAAILNRFDQVFDYEEAKCLGKAEELIKKIEGSN